MSHRSAAYFLVGPTASGKTAVAEALARRTGAFVLSADSMLVYRGMDVGTAKPGPDERAEGRLRGIDLADPDESFSAGKWLAAAASAFAEAEAAGSDVIVAGGTGLYVGALIHGLDAPPASAAARAEAEAALASGGIAALAERIEAMSPGATADIDRTNPRRLSRLFEVLRSGGAAPRSRAAATRLATLSSPLAGLDFPPQALRERIAARAGAMFAGGAIQKEAAALCAAFPAFPESTAGGGIGYAEALALARGETTPEKALESTITRTNHLAKRQRTWWRTQARVEWVGGPKDASDVPRAAAEVAAIWEKHGKTPVALP